MGNWSRHRGGAPARRRAVRMPGCAPGRCASVRFRSVVAAVGMAVKPGQRVLIVRGSDGQNDSAVQGVGRDWFAKRVSEAGAAVDFVVSYRRARPHLDAAQLQLAREAAADGSVWLFSSSEACPICWLVCRSRIGGPRGRWRPMPASRRQPGRPDLAGSTNPARPWPTSGAR